MLLDFELLSMTDLRNRPGEILDRVADGQQAFIIERSGKRKACLVPLSVFFPDIAPSRIAEEIGQLKDSGELPRTTITERREMVFRFSHAASDDCRIEISILLPHGYPHSCPRVYAKELKPGTPHVWSDGALCLYGVMTGWNPGKHTVLSTLMLARSWLQHYDVWCETGEWPK
jgi:prevent-host-death family protein